jgi:hypothetical protein
METKFLLIRHASVDPIGKLIAGRRHGVHLNEKGRTEAEHLIERLSVTPKRKFLLPALRKKCHQRRKSWSKSPGPRRKRRRDDRSGDDLERTQ